MTGSIRTATTVTATRIHGGSHGVVVLLSCHVVRAGDWLHFFARTTTMILFTTVRFGAHDRR